MDYLEHCHAFHATESYSYYLAATPATGRAYVIVQDHDDDETVRIPLAEFMAIGNSGAVAALESYVAALISPAPAIEVELDESALAA